MHKIPTLFVRGEDRRYVTRDVTPGCEWVVRGEGTATRKHDGTCCIVESDYAQNRYADADVEPQLWKRHQIKPGQAEPEEYYEVEYDDQTGKSFGWVPVGDGPEDRWHREAWNRGADYHGQPFIVGTTYELIGPKVQGNPEHTSHHVLVRHGSVRLAAPRDFDSIRYYLQQHPGMEGIVWWNENTGEKAKIKRRDFLREF